MSKVLEMQNIIKKYGDKNILKNITLSVDRGSCFGLLGPNGAGKSTTMKILAGIIDFDGGTLRILDKDSAKSRNELRKSIGYVPQEITVYEKLSAYNNLIFFGELYGMKGNALRTRIDEVLDQVGLKERAKDIVATFSGGMKRRINIAAALLHKPELLILDEPTVGVDPQSRNHIFNMIKSLQEDGMTIIYSTHYMEEVEALCDDIAIVDSGEVLARGRLSELLHRFGNDSIYVESDAFKEAPNLSLAKKVYSKGQGWIIETESILETISEITQKAINEKITLTELGILRSSLETIFLKLTGTSLRDK